MTLIEGLYASMKIGFTGQIQTIMLQLRQEISTGEVLLCQDDMHPRMVNHKQDIESSELGVG